MHAVFVVLVAIGIVILVLAFVGLRVVIRIVIAICGAAVVITTALTPPRGGAGFGCTRRGRARA